MHDARRVRHDACSTWVDAPTAAHGGAEGGPMRECGRGRPGVCAGLVASLVLLVAGGARAAITTPTLVGSLGVQTTGTTLAVTNAGATIPVGSTVIVTVAMNPVAGTISCADSAGNTYSLDVNATNGSGTDGVRAALFSTRVTSAIPTGGTITVTHPSDDRRAMVVMQTAGLLSPNPLDQTANGTGSGTVVSSGNVTTTVADELLVGAVAAESKKDTLLIPGAGFTQLHSENSGTAGGQTNNVTTYAIYQIVTATGTYAGGGTLTQSRVWVAPFATYKASPVCGDGAIGVGEQCDDGNTANGDCCSSTCQFEAAGTICRAAIGPCDVAETCTGSSATCPADALAPTSTVCRGSAGVCDVAETCTGSSAVCPADAFAPSGTTCRASAGVCDVAETCTGASAACPADAFQPSSTTCRGSAGVCDVAETCTGSSAACPADGFA